MGIEEILLGFGLGGVTGFSARMLMERGISKEPIPDEIQRIASEILLRRTWEMQTLNLMLWYITSYNPIGYLFGAQIPTTPRSIEALVSIAPTATPDMYSVEVSKMAFAQIDLYYRGILLTTFPEVPASDTLSYGYYQFHTI